MKGEIRQVNGLTLVGKADSGHWITMDAAEQLGGANAAARPLELFLIGLGGCMSMDVISILQKKRIKLDDFQCTLETDQAEQHPKVFIRVRIKFILYGDNIPKEAVERSIELSETKYCSASAMLRKSTEIEIGYEIRSSK
jgi:putative redox protein